MVDLSDWLSKLSIVTPLNKPLESGVEYFFTVDLPDGAVSLWSKDKEFLGELKNGKIPFIAGAADDEIIVLSNVVTDHVDLFLCLQHDDYPYQPAPEDLQYAKQYDLAEPLQLNTDYTLAVYGDLSDWTGVWLGDSYFAGYLEDGALHFQAPVGVSFDHIIIKSLTDTATIDRVMLSQSTSKQDWQPAPEDKADTSSLGDMAYENSVELAKLGSTVIDGGFLKTNLIRVDGSSSFADGYNPALKCRVFSSQPVPPYDVGDLWTGGSSGDIKRCKTAKLADGAYAAADWELASKYTDDSAVGTLAGSLGDMAYETWVEWAKLGSTVIDGGYFKTNLIKVDGSTAFAANYDPSKKKQTYTSEPTTPYYVGDLWAQGIAGSLMVCKTERLVGLYNSADWEEANMPAETAQDNLAQSLGYTDYADMVAAAAADETIISGGYLRTSLIDVDNLYVKRLMAKSDVVNFVTFEPYYTWSGQTFSGTQYWTDDAAASPVPVQHLLLLGDVNKSNKESQTIITATALDTASDLLNYEANLKIGAMVPTQLGDGNYGYIEFSGNTDTGNGFVGINTGNSNGSAYFNLNVLHNELALWDASGKVLEFTRTNGPKFLTNKIWHEGNDGTGSGLDADKLDGNDSTAFTRINAATISDAAVINNLMNNGLYTRSNTSGSSGFPELYAQTWFFSGASWGRDFALFKANEYDRWYLAGVNSSRNGFTTPQQIHTGNISTQTASSASSTNLWTRIAKISLRNQYRNLAIDFLINGICSTTGLPYRAFLYLSVLQQAAMGSAPSGRICLDGFTGLGTANVKAIITENSASLTEIQIWIEAVHTYKTFTAKVLNEYGTGEVDYTMSGWTALASLPAGSTLTVLNVTNYLPISGGTLTGNLTMGSNNIVGSTTDCEITARRIGLGVAANATYSMDASTTGNIRFNSAYANSAYRIGASIGQGIASMKVYDSLNSRYIQMSFVGGILVGVAYS